MVSDAGLLLVALVGLSATVLCVLFAAGYFRGLQRVADAGERDADDDAEVVRAGGRRGAAGGLAALRRRQDKKKARGEAQEPPPAAENDAAGELEVAAENADALVEPRAMTKKELQKEMKRREREEMRLFEETRREELKKKTEAKEEALQKKREEDAKAEAEREAAEQRLLAEKAKKEQEEFDAWKGLFVVEEQGSKLAEDSEESQSLLQQFVDYIKSHKVVLLEDLAAEFNLATQDAIQRVEALQAANRLTGIVDDRGKFIYITEDEMDKVVKYVQRKGRMSLSELAKECNKLIRLEGDATSSAAPLAVDWLDEAAAQDGESKEPSP